MELKFKDVVEYKIDHSKRLKLIRKCLENMTKEEIIDGILKHEERILNEFLEKDCKIPKE